jgi:hypothetical protein
MQLFVFYFYLFIFFCPLFFSLFFRRNIYLSPTDVLQSPTSKAIHLRKKVANVHRYCFKFEGKKKETNWKNKPNKNRKLDMGVTAENTAPQQSTTTSETSV